MGAGLSCKRCVSQGFSFGKRNPASPGAHVLSWWSILSGEGEGGCKEGRLPFFFLVFVPFLGCVKSILGPLTSAEWQSTGKKLGTCVFVRCLPLPNVCAEQLAPKFTISAKNVSGKESVLLALHWIICCCSVGMKVLQWTVGQCWWGSSALFCSGKYASWLIEDALRRWDWICISWYPLYCS